MIEDARRGFADIAAGRVVEADQALADIQRQRRSGIRPPSVARLGTTAKRFMGRRGSS
jgi:hypothetical protein